MRQAVQVEIMGQTFSVTSEDGEDHVRRVAGYVDGKMREVTAGGRVLNVTALGDGTQSAREHAYAAADVIDFDGRQLRRDIAA